MKYAAKGGSERGGEGTKSASLEQQGLIWSLNRKFQHSGAGETLEQPRKADREPLLELSIKSICNCDGVCLWLINSDYGDSLRSHSVDRTSEGSTLNSVAHWTSVCELFKNVWRWTLVHLMHPLMCACMWMLFHRAMQTGFHAAPALQHKRLVVCGPWLVNSVCFSWALQLPSANMLGRKHQRAIRVTALLIRQLLILSEHHRWWFYQTKKKNQTHI